MNELIVVTRLVRTLRESIEELVASARYKFLLICELDSTLDQTSLRKVLVQSLHVPESMLLGKVLAAFSAKLPLPLDFDDESQFPNFSSVAFLNTVPDDYEPIAFSYVASEVFQDVSKRPRSWPTADAIAAHMRSYGLELVVTWCEFDAAITLPD